MPNKNRPEPAVEVGRWSAAARPTWRVFHGPKSASTLVPLRVALDRPAWGDASLHARESLDSEVCGVLAGELCEDEEGTWLHVKATVRGKTDQRGSAHVTFTQETWNGIHAEMERLHPRLKIVGWYHTHPGFGAEFSSMDHFIQKNFFALPSQVALLTDPLGSETALLVNGPDGPVNADRFWVDEREQRARMPSAVQATAVGGHDGASLQALETRLSQALRSLDELRSSLYRWLFASFATIVLLLGLLFGGQLYRVWLAPWDPPKDITVVPVPIQIGDEVMILGLRVEGYRVPQSLLPNLAQPQEGPSSGAATSSPVAPTP